MNKRMLSFILAVLMLAGMAPGVFAAGLPFADVAEGAWYYEDVSYAYTSGLVNGKTDTAFEPDSCLSYAEAVKLAACMHQKRYEGEVTLTNGEPWYQSYVDYAKAEGIISRDYQWSEFADRAGYMEIFAAAFADAELPAVNTVADGAIPDVDMSHPQAAAIYKLYRAGVVQGSDAAHSCFPADNIKRSEVASIVARMMQPEKRLSFTLETAPELPDEPVLPSEPVLPDTPEEPEYVYHEKVPILMYHEVNYNVLNDLYLSVANFEAHLDYFARAGITPITMQELLDHWLNGAPLPEKPIVLTFDDGYRSMYEIVYPLLKERGWPGTFYCIAGTRWMDNYVTNAMILEMVQNGMEIGNHTVSHIPLTSLYGEQLKLEIELAKSDLSDSAGMAVTQFCYPTGRYDPVSVAAVMEAGHSSAVTTEWGFATEAHGLWTLPRLRISSATTAQALESVLSQIGY